MNTNYNMLKYNRKTKGSEDQLSVKTAQCCAIICETTYKKTSALSILITYHGVIFHCFQGPPLVDPARATLATLRRNLLHL